MAKKSLNKRAALVTGGAVRVGKAIALALAQEGYDIALHYNSSEKEALKTKKEIEKLGSACEIFKADISVAQNTKKLISDAAKKFPNLNVLVNSASIFEKASFLETDEDFFDRHFNVNLKAPFFLSKYFAERKTGNIINILDTHVTSHKTSFFAYLLSKKSLRDLTLQLAAELGPKIRINAVAPGIILPSKGREDDYIKTLEKKLPLGKISSTKEVVESIKFILQSNLTGQIIYTDGGRNLI